MATTSKKLTAQRLFSSPPLLQITPVDMRFTPDGDAVTFRAASVENREQYDLFRVPLRSSALQADNLEPWISTAELQDLEADTTKMSAEERADRERRRDFSYGVTQYMWRPAHPHQLLLPLGGNAHLLDTRRDKPTESLRTITSGSTRKSAFQFSPAGRYLSYVENRDLYIVDLETEIATRITQDASVSVSNGLADFLAAEEMHRFHGHWWGLAEDKLYYTRVDETPVKISHRLEMEADGTRTVEQRYPFAGENNPDVSLWCRDLTSGDTRNIWQNSEHEAYLGRVNFCGTQIILQVQNRLQNVLRFLSLDTTLSASDSTVLPRTLHEVICPTWINLTDDYCALSNTSFITSVESSGTRNLLHIEFSIESHSQEASKELSGASTNEITGPTHINQLHHADSELAWVSGWQDDPTQNHLYRIELQTGATTQISTEQGWHEFILDHQHEQFLDTVSTPTDPVSIRAFRLGGEKLATLFEDRVTPSHPYAPYSSAHSIPEIGSIEHDGVDLYYRLTPPVQPQGSHPVIVYVYGGPGAQRVQRSFGPLLLQLFAHHGFGVLELDNRGSSNRGAVFEAPLYRAMGTIEVEDQVAGLDVLQKTSWADPDRVGVFGHSYGGYMSLMCMTQAAEHFQAGVAVAPVCDWHLYDSHYTERYMGLPEDNRDGYRLGNVLTHLENLEGPLLLMHGMADDNVLFTNTTMIMAELQRLNKPFELMTYPGAKHSMQEPHINIHRFNMILDFFTRQLGR